MVLTQEAILLEEGRQKGQTDVRMALTDVYISQQSYKSGQKASIHDIYQHYNSSFYVLYYSILAHFYQVEFACLVKCSFFILCHDLWRRLSFHYLHCFK